MSEINITPMVDVMLVLLIIFMVTAPLMQQGVKVQLPETRAQPLDVKPDLIVLTVTHDKKIYLGKVRIPYKKLRQKLENNIKLKDDKEIYLHADRRLDYGFVVDIMAMLKDVGVQNLGMVTDPVIGR